MMIINKRIIYRYILPVIMLVVIAIFVVDLNKSDELKHKLFNSVKHGGFVDIEKALEAGADINSKNAVGQTPLHSLAYKGIPEKIKFLVKRGADLDERDYKGGTPLHWGVINGRVQNVQMLIKLGADTNADDNKGGTPLHWAVNALKINEPTKTVNVLILLEAGADPYIKDDSGRTPIDYARMKKMPNLVEIMQIPVEFAE